MHGLDTIRAMNDGKYPVAKKLKTRHIISAIAEPFAPGRGPLQG